MKSPPAAFRFGQTNVHGHIMQLESTHGVVVKIPFDSFDSRICEDEDIVYWANPLAAPAEILTIGQTRLLTKLFDYWATAGMTKTAPSFWGTFTLITRRKF